MSSPSELKQLELSLTAPAVINLRKSEAEAEYLKRGRSEAGVPRIVYSGILARNMKFSTESS